MQHARAKVASRGIQAFVRTVCAGGSHWLPQAHALLDNLLMLTREFYFVLCVPGCIAHLAHKGGRISADGAVYGILYPTRGFGDIDVKGRVSCAIAHFLGF